MKTRHCRFRHLSFPSCNAAHPLPQGEFINVRKSIFDFANPTTLAI